MFGGKIKCSRYQDVLEEGLFPSMEVIYPDGYSIQQDNAPPHVFHSTNKFLWSEDLTWLGTGPPNSPDRNPIENVWGRMKKWSRLPRRPSLDSWRKEIEKMFESLEFSYLRKLVDSMPRQLAACIAAQGSHTRY